MRVRRELSRGTARDSVRGMDIGTREALEDGVARLSKAFYGEGAPLNDYGAANAIALLEIAITRKARPWLVWRMAWEAAKRDTTEPPNPESEEAYLQHALHDFLRAFGLGLGGGVEAQTLYDRTLRWLGKAESARAAKAKSKGAQRAEQAGRGAASPRPVQREGSKRGE